MYRKLAPYVSAPPKMWRSLTSSNITKLAGVNGCGKVASTLTWFQPAKGVSDGILWRERVGEGAVWGAEMSYVAHTIPRCKTQIKGFLNWEGREEVNCHWKGEAKVASHAADRCKIAEGAESYKSGKIWKSRQNCNESPYNPSQSCLLFRLWWIFPSQFAPYPS